MSGMIGRPCTMSGADGNNRDVKTTTGRVSARQAKKSTPKNSTFSVPKPIFVIVIIRLHNSFIEPTSYNVSLKKTMRSVGFITVPVKSRKIF